MSNPSKGAREFVAGSERPQAPAVRGDRLLVVSPCRNEAKYLRRSVASVLAQTRRPDLWVIVDDGSSDETAAILAETVKALDFVQVLRRSDRGFRQVGPGVIDAFDAGLAAAGDLSRFEYVSKLDLDLDLPATYFETMIEHMHRDPRLGTISGKAMIESPKGMVYEGQADDMSLGMAKVYRRRCLQEIGGLVRAVMWDGIDCHQARRRGWRACSFRDQRSDFIHLRPMGSSEHGILNGRFRHGKGQYFMGTGGFYMAVSAVRWSLRPPILLGGAAMFAGWAWSALKGAPRYQDPGFRAFLRRYQWLALLKGKRVATEAVLSPQHSEPEGDFELQDAA